jgi:AbrB family looped-hinge helix DNA binding protein
VYSVVKSFPKCVGIEAEPSIGRHLRNRFWKSSCRAKETLVGYSYQEIGMASRLKTLEYLATTKIGEKGQLTVPKQFRKDLGLGTGAPFAVLRLGDGLVLLPEQQRFQHLCEQVSETLTGAGLTPEQVLATLPEARNRVFERRYKKPGSSKKTSRRRSRATR